VEVVITAALMVAAAVEQMLDLAVLAALARLVWL
jgi:hypothetical protein